MEKDIFLEIFSRLKKEGKFFSPRGLKVLEIENFHFDFPPYIRFMNFESRKLNLSYIKEEFKWYLRGNRFDSSIIKHAKLWGEIQNDDGSINSNYGQYIWGGQNQYDRVIQTLVSDKDSRQAIIMILNEKHLASVTKDYPCTCSINFRIRDDKLNMTVHMRSMDAIYGAGNDFPTFSFVHEMMLRSLQQYYPDLKYGIYHHSADSFHVYEKHFDMLENILAGDEFEKVDCPRILDSGEIDHLRVMNYLTALRTPKEFKFAKWLNS